MQMSFIFVILSVVLFVTCIAINVMILMQQKKAGMSAGVAGMGGGGGGDTYWDKNKKRSLEGKLERYCKIGGGIFMILALVLNFIG